MQDNPMAFNPEIIVPLVVFYFFAVGVVTTIRYINSIPDRIRAKFKKKQPITASDIEPRKMPARAKRPRSYDESAIQVKSRVLMINYTDGDGETTIRKIKTASYKPKAKLLFAHCHLAGEQRTFRIDRINTATAAGGKFIPDMMNYLSSIHRGTTL
jgi:predicted DNA-binding transcriptional regulator YafY